MALITDPDDLSQGGSTSVSDAVWGTPTGAAVTITSSGAELPAIGSGEYFEVRDHSASENNGLYVTTGSPTTSSIACEKVSGSNPSAASSEAVTTLGTTADPKSVMFDTAARHIYLLEQGNLDSDGVTGQAVYSFAMKRWKDDDFLIAAAPFPMFAISANAGEYLIGQDASGNFSGWDFIDVSAASIRSRKLLRNAGWTSYDADGNVRQIYAGIGTQGTFEDPANDVAYYVFGADTASNLSVDFTFSGPVNEPVLCYDATVTQAASYTFVDGGGSNDSITRPSGSFYSDGFRVGGSVVVSSANTSANDGTYEILAMSATTLEVATGSLTADATDTSAVLAVDNRASFSLYLRVRDGDALGKTFDESYLSKIGETQLGGRKFAFALSNGSDASIAVTDATIDGSAPYTGMSLTFYASAQSLGGSGVLVGGPYNFGVVLDANGGTNTELYAWLQRQLRKTSDVDAGGGTVIGRMLRGFCRFLGPTLQLGSVDGGVSFPTNPLGGGSGVYVENLSATSQNDTVMFDNTGTLRGFPVSVACTIDMNATLLADDENEYWVFFDRTIRNTVSDLVINAGTAAVGTFASAGGNLPASLNRGAGAFVRVSGLTGDDVAMNGVYQVTTLTSTSEWDVRRYDGATIVTTSSAELYLDENCIDTPDAIIVDDNTGTDVTGEGVSADPTFAFDYSNNIQGGRTGGTDAYVVGRAIGYSTAQFTQSSVQQIQSGVPLVIPLAAAQERNVSG